MDALLSLIRKRSGEIEILRAQGSSLQQENDRLQSRVKELEDALRYVKNALSMMPEEDRAENDIDHEIQFIEDILKKDKAIQGGSDGK